MKNFSDIVAKLPAGPGVYQFFNQEKELLYIGKAKDLKKRASSYFRKSAKHSPRIQKMLESANDLKWIETNSEMEALILEDNLVKELQPKYNVLLRDDKTFQYIKVTLQDDYPEIYTVRQILKDNAKYFGPKTSGSDVRRLMESVKRIFKLCSAKNISVDHSGHPLEGAKVAVRVGGSAAKRPCLDYHIKRCTGPCAGMVTPEEYSRQIDAAIQFLSGNYRPAIEQLKGQMMEFARQKKFERAAKLRDHISAIERSAEKQLITDTTIIDRDVIGCVEDLGKSYFNLFQIRAGRLVGQENFVLDSGDQPSEAMEAFLRDYYAMAADIPKEVLISVELENSKLMQHYIRQFTAKAVRLIHPQAGKKDDLVLLSEKNARSYAEQNRAKWMADKREERALEELKTVLNLSAIPQRIECFDISHLSGTETVGSMVVFKKGKPSPSDYRQFRIKTAKAGEIDDFKCMAEVIRRRLRYLPDVLPEGYPMERAKKKDEKILKAIHPSLNDFNPGDFYVIRHQKRVIATGMIEKLSEKVHRITALWVEEKERGKKLGHFMIKKLIDQSKNKRLYLICKAPLEHYYLDLGFETLHRPPAELRQAVEAHSSSGQRIFMAYQKKKKDPSFSAEPDLMVIDGGKGQLNAAYEALLSKFENPLQRAGRRNSNIPNPKLQIVMIALAKRLEEVFVPGKSDPINLPSNSEASYLLQRLRDEAHRFAITFNRSSRDNKMVKSALDDIPGVGPKMKKRLLNYFGTVPKIRQASQAVLEQVVGEKMAKMIKEKL